jgi:hypothetical protein
MLIFLKQMLSSDPVVSTTRFITIVGPLVILAIFAGHNVISMIKGGGYIDFEVNSVMALLVFMGAKVGQSFSEKSNSK